MGLSAVKKGISTISWGCDNIMNIPSGAIIESGKITPKNGEPIEIEDGQGFAAVEVFLDDGFNATVAFLYDQAKAWPNVAQKVTLTLPAWNNTANANTITYNCFVAATPELDLARKKEGTITYQIRYRPGLDMPNW